LSAGSGDFPVSRAVAYNAGSGRSKASLTGRFENLPHVAACFIRSQQQAISKNVFDSSQVCENLATTLTNMMKTVLSACLAVTFGFSLLSSSAAEKNKSSVDVSKLPPPADKKGVTFAADIKPIFDKSCVSCHGPEKSKGKLRLDSLEAALKGGEDGKVIEPGNSAGSLAVHNVAHIGDPDDYMPPPKNKGNIPPLTPEQIGLIRAWIDQGAK
jgi:mono/diheme cytochrome c family protein